MRDYQKLSDEHDHRHGKNARQSCFKTFRQALKFWRTRRSTSLGAGVGIVTFTLLFNMCATIYLRLHFVPELGYASDIRPANPRLYIGNCSTAAKLNTYLHILINALSTLLLASSNMFMQLMLAPTRLEIDRAHKRQQYLEIGIPNLRNLRYVSWRNRLVWLLLATSSLPLHLIYNSAIYLAKPMNHVTMQIVSPEFLTGAPANATFMYFSHDWRRTWNMTGLSRRDKGPKVMTYQPIDIDGLFNANRVCNLTNCADTQRYIREKKYSRRLNAYDCLSNYSSYAGDRSDVIFVSSYDSYWNMSTSVPHFTSNGSTVTRWTNATGKSGVVKNSLLFTKSVTTMSLVDVWLEYEWLCGLTNSFDCRAPAAWARDPSIVKNWNILGYKIDECLVTDRPTEDKCAVSYSLEIMIIVCTVNIIKLICMLYSMSILADEGVMTKPLATIGDAVSSFLCMRDDTTTSLALVNKRTVINDKASWSLQRTSMWVIDRSKWYKLVSKKRLFMTFGLMLAVIGAGIGFVIQAFMLIVSRSGSIKHILEIPFGVTDQTTFGQLGLPITANDRKSTMTGFILIILFANMWQLFISFVYICLNALFTCFCVEAEWQKYGIRRKTLRVSSPLGQQRSTYFLSLPWRYGAPLMLASTLLHWTLSQSLFLTVLTVYKAAGFQEELLFIGTSPKPLITTVGIGFIFVFILVGICFRKSQGILPRGGSCSVVISAACHQPAADVDAAFKPVKWGEVVEHNMPNLKSPSSRSSAVMEYTEYGHDQTSDTTPGHCCFTSYEVVLPTIGRAYI